MSKMISKMNLISAVQQLPKEDVEIVQSYVEMLEDEIEAAKQVAEDYLKKEIELKKQLDYLRSHEYLNQLRFERDMLQHVVDNVEVSKEDKEFIDMTHRNTELLEQQKEFTEYLINYIGGLNSLEIVGNREHYYELSIVRAILSKYKEIIGYSE